MTGTVHALVGAALGRLCGNRPLAFALGSLSHAVCDVIPHAEVPLQPDLVLLGAALGGVAGRWGFGSPEFMGALGALAPDAEHALVVGGAIPGSLRVFPTHNRTLPHGRGRECASQIALGAAALLAMGIAGQRRSGRQQCCPPTAR